MKFFDTVFALAIAIGFLAKFKSWRRSIYPLVLTGVLVVPLTAAAVTTTWDDKSNGQMVSCLPDGCVTWPDNDIWTEDLITGPHPFDSNLIVTRRPGNWSTDLYPDNGRGGVNYNVIVDAAPPVNLFTSSVTVDDVTVSSSGVVRIRERSTLTLL